MKEKEYIYKFNLVAANIFSIFILILLCVITFLLNRGININIKFILTTLLLYFALHEVLHGIGYILGGAKPKNIYFGVALEKGILYCLCREEVKKKCILASLQMPFMVIGVITYIISILINNELLLILSIANLVGASMDIVMFLYIAGIKKVRYSETDANDEFVLISKEDLTKKKSIFFKIKEVKDYNKKDFEFKKMKRVTISKFSFVALIIVILLDLIVGYL
jgi:hypothetical protein